MNRPYLLCSVAFLPTLSCCSEATSTECQDRVTLARKNTEKEFGEFFGKPVFIRIIKETRALELWVHHDGKWQVLHKFTIAGMSGELGPKTAEGDLQAPEGFYDVVPGRMNPRSNYHLSFNIGYPNKRDLELGRNGSLIMVHGSDVSIGCFAITDEGIEKVYTMINEAFRGGQKRVLVQIYPFEMTPDRMQEERNSPHFEFWQELQIGWNHTHDKQEPYPAP